MYPCPCAIYTLFFSVIFSGNLGRSFNEPFSTNFGVGKNSTDRTLATVAAKVRFEPEVTNAALYTYVRLATRPVRNESA